MKKARGALENPALKVAPQKPITVIVLMQAVLLEHAHVWATARALGQLNAVLTFSMLEPVIGQPG